MLCIGCLIFIGNKINLNVKAEHIWCDYNINEVDLYNETNTYAYNFIEYGNKPNQYFDMTTQVTQTIATVSQYGTIKANHSGETKIYGVYKYNSRYLVEITVVVITG